MVMISTFTTGLGALSCYVDARVTGRFKEFRVSPITRTQLILSYQLAAFLVSRIMSLGILLLGTALLAAIYQTFPGWMELLTLVGLVILLCFAFPALSSFILTYISSNAGYTGLSVIVGTLPGFVSGAYLPIETLSESVVNALNVLPFSPAAMLLRKPLGGDVESCYENAARFPRENLGPRPPNAS